MIEITIEDLHGYLDEGLSDVETARIERALRQSAALRQLLRSIMQERDRGEHTVGAIWRRYRISCPSREHLGSYVLGVMEESFQEYVRFHLDVIWLFLLPGKPRGPAESPKGAGSQGATAAPQAVRIKRGLLRRP